MSKLPSLYNIAADYLSAMEILADMETDEQTITDTLEGLAGTLEIKAVNVAMFTENLEVIARAIKERESEMAQRRKAIENKVARMRDYIKDSMERTGILKIETPDMVLRVQDNPPAVQIEDDLKIPSEFMKVPEPPPPAPDKKAIADALKSGREIPGAWLKRGTRLVIK